MAKSLWGKTAEGAEVHLYTLTSGEIEVRVTDFGAHLVAIRTPDRAGNVADVVLGFDSLQGYLHVPNAHLGAVVGRYGNRIALGRFVIDGQTFQIPVNNGPNALHGGPKGFDRYIWQSHEQPDCVEFTHLSPDGDMGFPGALTARVRYTLSTNVLRLDYTASTDRATVLNLTNHAYFNLRGDDDGDILGHQVQIDASHYTPTDAGQIPTGEIAAVAGTPLDFRTPAVIGARIDNPFEQIELGRGYDHNFVVDGPAGTLRRAAHVTEPSTGRTLTVETTEPAVQFYTGNFLDGTLTGRHGKKYAQRTGFCLETQHFPDSPNHPHFPTTLLRPGETFRSTTTFAFGAA
jgi:aldose 1-epimerase